MQMAHLDVDWRLRTNDDFVNRIVKPTLENASDVADSSELFVRSAKLLETTGYRLIPPWTTPNGPTPPNGPPPPIGQPKGRIQPLVEDLMRTLLVARPALLSDGEKRDLQDNVYCKRSIGLRIGFPLIRRVELGRKGNDGRDRYYARPYGEFYVCNDWWPYNHCANAKSLLAWVEDLTRRNPAQEDALRPHAQAFGDYMAGNCA